MASDGVYLPSWRELVWVIRELPLQIGAIMATLSDLKSAVDQLAANDAALASHMGELHDAIEQLHDAQSQVSTNLSAEDQATLDAAVQSVTNVSANLASEAQSISASQQPAMPPVEEQSDETGTTDVSGTDPLASTPAG